MKRKTDQRSKIPTALVGAFSCRGAESLRLLERSLVSVITEDLQFSMAKQQVVAFLIQ